MNNNLYKTIKKTKPNLQKTPVQQYKQPNTSKKPKSIFQTQPDILADCLKIKDMLMELHLKFLGG